MGKQRLKRAYRTNIATSRQEKYFDKSKKNILYIFFPCSLAGGFAPPFLTSELGITPTATQRQHGVWLVALLFPAFASPLNAEKEEKDRVANMVKQVKHVAVLSGDALIFIIQEVNFCK